MHLCLIDVGRGYDVDRPLHTPLGGSQSAACFLARALADAGVSVTLATAGDFRGLRAGVAHCPWTELDIAGMDALVALNGPVDLIERLPAGPARLLWTQHMPDEPAMAALASHGGAWDHVVAVSDHHRAVLLAAATLDPARVHVRRNAMAPAFAGLTPRRDGPPRLAYTSTPFRGLDVLLAIFPRLRQRHPDVMLDVYSSLAVYGTDPAADPCRNLYGIAESLAGVTWHGSIPQPDLAPALAATDLLAYPNTFPETSCIAVIEALAAGCHVVTSDLGALPETTQGFADLVPFDGQDRARFALDFLAALDKALTSLHDPTDQIATLNRTATWDIRAREWVKLISRIRA